MSAENGVATCVFKVRSTESHNAIVLHVVTNLTANSMEQNSWRKAASSYSSQERLHF